MPLPLPSLDTLRYDALVAEALDAIPYRAPDWTDFNAHDPGVTLVELFAWVTEADSYRLDRVPQRSDRAFLRLLGQRECPARVARTVLAFVPTAGLVDLPGGLQVGVPRFQTGTPFDAVDCLIVALLACSASVWTEYSPTQPGWRPLGDDPAAGDAFYVGLDDAPPAGRRVRLFALTDDPAGDEQTWHALHAERRRNRRDTRRGCRACGCAAALWRHHGAEVAWEYFDGFRWQALPDLVDGTRALSLSGPLRFRVPVDMQAGGVPGHAGQWFVRCRLVAGGYDCPPRLEALLLNAVLARHRADNPVRDVGASTGHASQRFDVSREPIVAGSTQATLTLPDGTQTTWEERPDFDRSGPLARHFVVDPERGQVVFGDGRAGRVPDAATEPGKLARLTVRWQTGGGVGGNLPAGTLSSTLAAWAVTVSQPVAAWGGAAAETPGEAKARAVRTLAQARCCVTLDDFEQAALRVPGAPVARARALAEFDPELACLPVAGCVTVVIVSPCVRTRPDPTAGLRHAVRCYLETRRPVATEVHVTGPEWTTLAVKATLRVRRGSDAVALRAEAVRRIGAFFDPLAGGPEQTGWPFGRPVFRTEVMALLDAMPGVLAVEGLALAAGDGPDDTCNNVALCPNGLVRPGTHAITVSPEFTK